MRCSHQEIQIQDTSKLLPLHGICNNSYFESLGGNIFGKARNLISRVGLRLILGQFWVHFRFGYDLFRVYLNFLWRVRVDVVWCMVFL